MNGYKENRKLAATLYPLVGLEGTCYEFRVLKVREPIPEDNLRPIRLQRWADRLWRRELRCPVYPSARFGFPAFLIPEGDSPAAGSTIEIKDVPDKLYHIDVTDQMAEVSIDSAAGAERELVCRMLERPFTESFLSLRDEFWKVEWTLFFRLVPENEGVAEDIANAYRGLKFRVVLLEGMGPHFAADIRTKYVGRRSLAEYPEPDTKTTLRKHLDLEIPVDDRASYIRDNGPVKILCRYTGDTGETIDECTFDESGETVFQYYRRRYRSVPVHPKDACVFVQDRVGKDESLPVPISRLFPVFTTEYEELRKCSIRPQMTPEARASTIATFLGYLSGVRYGDIPISIGTPCLMKERTVFIPPRLEFGNGEIINPFPKGSPPKSSRLFDSLTVRWGSKKLPALYRAGPWHNEPLPDVVLLYPNTINRSPRETFRKVLSQEIQRQTGQSIRIIQQRSYSVGRLERMGSSLLRLAAEVRSGNPRCLAVVILWDRFMRSVHGELKEAINPVLSQCVTERTVRSICTRFDPQRATSQLRNLALAVLTEAGVKPWVLADALHHDLHIGIDTLFGRVGYHFLYGTGGRYTERQLGECTVRGRWKVAIKKPDLRRRIEESVRSIVENGHPIKSIIIHRDGRWWSSESVALREALQRLKVDNVLPFDVRCAAVEIRKNHMPVRLFTAVVEERGTFLQNPLPGTYLILDQCRALLTTTGRPGAWDRRGVSAGTLLLEVVDSIREIDIGEVAEDAYWLTHLNWNAPDIEIAHPVTIRWTDEALRETLRSPAQEEEDEEEWELEASESDEPASSILDKEEFIL
jgi:hypothetical protein